MKISDIHLEITKNFISFSNPVWIDLNKKNNNNIIFNKTNVKQFVLINLLNESNPSFLSKENNKNNDHELKNKISYEEIMEDHFFFCKEKQIYVC